MSRTKHVLRTRAPRDTHARSLEGKREAVEDNYQALFDFYQAETVRAARRYQWLQGITLVGSALTPIVLLLPQLDKCAYGKLIQALPAAIAGIASALNASFAFRDDWAESYATLSALDDEYRRYLARVSPDYNGDETEALDTLQNRISLLSNAEVKSWASRVTARKEPGPGSRGH